MSRSVAAALRSAPAFARIDAARLAWPAVGLIAVLTALWHLSVSICTDVSWLLVVADRMLSGEVLYRDVLETNPPASILLYTPAMIAEHLLGFRAESVVVLTTGAAALASLAAADGIIRGAGRTVPPWALVGGAGLLLVLPMGAFSQREHFALMAMVPLLALAVVRTDGGTAGRGTAIAAGLFAGLAMAIKPPLALGILLPAMFAAVRGRSVAPIVRIEHFAAAGVVLAYGAAVHVLFPDFAATMLPILREVYIPAHHPSSLIFGRIEVFWLAALGWLVAVYAGRRLANPALGVVFFAALGFGGAFVVQHKGWAYHAYPAYAAVLAAGALALSDGAGRRGSLRLGFAIVLTWGLVQGLAWTGENNLGLKALRTAAADTIRGRTVMAITSEIAVANPLTRDLGGRYVGSLFGQWMTAQAYLLRRGHPGDPAAAATAARYIALDHDYLRRDLETRWPEVLLIDRIDFDWLAWARQDPASWPPSWPLRPGGGGRRHRGLDPARRWRYALVMNYRHAYHAGNFADVVKHAVLARILAHLAQKDAAFRVVDTHAASASTTSPPTRR